MSFRLIGLWISVVGLACGRFGDADEAAIRKVVRAQQQAWNDGNLEAFMEGYLRSEDLVFTSGATVRRGWQTTLERYRERYPDRSAMGRLDFDRLQVRGTGPDSAVVLGRWRLTETGQAGQGVFTLVVVRTRSGWKIVHDHTSVGPPPAPQPRAVAITIDDLPVAMFSSYRDDAERLQVVEGICNIVRQRKLPVTGFVNMVHHRSQPELMKAWKACGIEFGNHTWSHPKLDAVGLDAFVKDLTAGHRALQGEWVPTGQAIPFRYPYLNQGFDREVRAGVQATLEQLASPHAPVTIDTLDWLYAKGYLQALHEGRTDLAERHFRNWAFNLQESTLSAERWAQELFSRQPPQILLIHANRLAAEHLSEYLDWLQARGYRFVSLQQALADPAYAEPDRSSSPIGESHWLRLRRSRTTAVWPQR